MNKQQFIIDQLKPYFLNPDLCGYQEGMCMNITKEGKMCVFGKNLVNPNTESGGEWTTNDLETYGQDILKPESRNMLNTIEWARMQDVHDNIAINSYNLLSSINRLEDDASTNLTDKKIDLTELKNLIK